MPDDVQNKNVNAAGAELKADFQIYFRLQKQYEHLEPVERKQRISEALDEMELSDIQRGDILRLVD